MLAQWVPLHAVSCSNLIETGGCAESREIPLRVTQACSGSVARAILRSRPRLTTRTAREPFTSRRTLLFLASVLGLINDRARSSTCPKTRVLEDSSRSRLWITILGTPAFFRSFVIFRPWEIADDFTERCQKLPSRHLTTLDSAGRTVRRFDEPSPWREVHSIEVSTREEIQDLKRANRPLSEHPIYRDEAVHWHSESLRSSSTRERTSTVTPRDRSSV